MRGEDRRRNARNHLQKVKFVLLHAKVVKPEGATPTRTFYPPPMRIRDPLDLMVTPASSSLAVRACCHVLLCFRNHRRLEQEFCSFRPLETNTGVNETHRVSWWLPATAHMLPTPRTTPKYRYPNPLLHVPQTRAPKPHRVEPRRRPRQKAAQPQPHGQDQNTSWDHPAHAPAVLSPRIGRDGHADETRPEVLQRRTRNHGAPAWSPRPPGSSRCVIDTFFFCRFRFPVSQVMALLEYHNVLLSSGGDGKFASSKSRILEAHCNNLDQGSAEGA